MIKKLLKFIVVGALAFGYAHLGIAADLQPLTITDFSCGKVDTQDPTLIGNGCAQQLWNTDVWTGRIQKRRGSTLQNSSDLGGFSSQATKFLFEYPDQNGNFWLISYSSNTLFASSNGGATNNTITSTCGFTAASDFSAANAFGKAYLTEGTTNWITFDGVNFIPSTAPPRGKVNAFMFGRLWTAGVTGTKSTLYYSRINDPNDWTDDNLDDGDAGSEFVRQNDGYDIRALIPFKNSLLIFKDYSIDSLTMANDGLTPIVTPISNNVGTQHRHSIVQTDNAIIFMGLDEFYEYTGPALNVISHDISNTFDSILQRNSASRSFTETTQADFRTGISSGVSPNISPGDILLSTTQFLDNSQSSFSSGTLSSGLSTTTSPGWLAFGGTFEDFSDGDYTQNPSWNAINSAPSIANNNADWNNIQGVITTTVTIATSVFTTTIFVTSTFDGSTFATLYLSTYLYTASNFPGSATPVSTTTITILIPQSVSLFGNDYSLYVGTVSTTQTAVETNSTNTWSVIFSTFGVRLMNYSNVNMNVARNLSNISYSYLTIGSLGTGNSPHTILDNLSFTPTTTTVLTSTFVSRAFSLGSLQTWYSSITANSSLNGSTFTFAVYGDTNTVIDITNSATFISSQTVLLATQTISTGSFSLAGSSYAFYSVFFNRTSKAGALLKSAQIDFRTSTGSYLGQSISLSNISSFGAFTENHTANGGTFLFELYTDTDTNINPSVASSFISSQTIVNNAVPTIATATFARIRVLPTITSYPFAPVFSDYTVTWNQGSANFPVWATFFEHEYHISVSTSNTSYNDTILIFDRNRSWVEYIGWNAYCLATYRQGIYLGDATRGRIYHYNVTSAYNDNNVAINTLWRSKEFDFGYPFSDKILAKYAVTAKYTANSDITFAYGVNRGSQTSTTLDLDSVAGAYRKLIVPSSLAYQRGQTHSFTIRDTDVDQPFDFLSVTLYPRLEPDPQ